MPLTSGSIAVVLGTRPEIIKLGHIIRQLGPAARVIHTGQHYDASLSDYFFDAFGLEEPSRVLGVGGRNRGEQIGAAILALDAVFKDQRPLAVLVQGDTNSTMAAAVAANARSIPIVHVEAGLRSFDRAMPEEHNRVVTDHLSDVCLAPTATSRENLLAEGIPMDRITITGNTVVEAVESLLPGEDGRNSILDAYGVETGKFALSTFHRPENVDDPETLQMILEELSKVDVPVLLPLHPRSRHRIESHGLSDLLDNLEVVDPIGYPDFLALLKESALAIGDSGGVQEEVSVLKRPMIVVRRSTERPEVLGTFARLIPAGRQIALEANRWLDDIEETHQRLADCPSPYGDGSASSRSVEALSALIERTT